MLQLFLNVMKSYRDSENRTSYFLIAFVTSSQESDIEK